MRTRSGAWKRRWKPGRRQRRQRGRARTKSRQYYRRNRSKILRKQRQRRRRPSWKNNPARKRSEKLRRRQNRRRRAELLDPALVALRFAEQRYSPANQRGGEDNKAQRKQTPSEARKDHLWYLRNRSRILPKAKRRYKTKCKPNAKCMDRREKYRERPEYYKRRPPQAGRTASVLTLPEIAFVVGPDMVLGFVDSLSPLTGMVTFRLDASNVSQIASMPVEIFLRAVTFLSDEDTQAFFDLVDVEIGLEAYGDLDEEGLRECAGLYDVDPDAEDFKEKCFELVGEGDISKMTVEALEEVNDVLVMGILEDGGEPRSDDDASENDEDIPDEYDPHLFYGEVEISKTAASVTKWTAANMLHEYVHDMEYGSQRVLGKRGSEWLISYKTYDGEEKQALVGGHENRSGRVFLSVRSVRGRLAGDVMLYDQGNPSNNEIKQPGEDVSYEATSPSHYRKSPDDKHGVPPGHALLDRDYNNTPPATSRVVPDSMGETLREQLTYVQASKTAGAREWLKWIVQPLEVLIKKYKGLVYGPLDDLLDEVFRDLAPKLVKELGEQEIDEDVDEYIDGAREGRFEALLDMYREPEPGQSEDYYEGYEWGFSNAHEWDGKRLPANVKRDVVREQIAEFREEVAEQVLISAMENAWSAINPREIFKTVMRAVKQHGWKIGLVYAVGELIENLVLPAALSAVTGVPVPPGSLAWLPLNDIVFAAVVKRLGRASDVEEFDPDGHLDWYESQFGAVRLASSTRVAARYRRS